MSFCSPLLKFVLKNFFITAFSAPDLALNAGSSSNNLIGANCAIGFSFNFSSCFCSNSCCNLFSSPLLSNSIFFSTGPNKLKSALSFNLSNSSFSFPTGGRDDDRPLSALNLLNFLPNFSNLLFTSCSAVLNCLNFFNGLLENFLLVSSENFFVRPFTANGSLISLNLRFPRPLSFCLRVATEKYTLSNGSACIYNLHLDIKFFKTQWASFRIFE